MDLLVAEPSGKTVKQRLSTVEGDENHDKAFAELWPVPRTGYGMCFCRTEPCGRSFLPEFKMY